jgi:TolB protein
VVDIVYASLPPGSVPNGERIVFRSRETGAETTAALTNGGFDPIAIPATVGDTLDVRLYLVDQTEPEESIAVVPERRPPVLVRVDPTPGRRDVPLNAVLLLVFSEPIDAATLTPSSVSLSRDGSPVAGALAFGDPARLAVKFTPSEDLAVGTDYTLRVTPAIRDQDGEALEAQVVVTFTTADPPADDPQDPIGPLENQELAFVRDGQIHVAHADGSGQIRLTDGPSDEDPAWSPDGRRIAFVSLQSGSSDIYIMDADGSIVARRTNGPPAVAPNWSPDGTRIAFASYQEGADIYAIAADDDGKEASYVVERVGWDGQPDWSPDGTLFAFASDWAYYDFASDIFVATAEGSQVTQLTYGLSFPGTLRQYLHPTWSPDGSVLAFLVGSMDAPNGWGPLQPMRFHVAIMSADGQSIGELAWAGDITWYDLLAPGPGSLTWSPDGQGIAYTFLDCDLILRTGCSKERSVKYVSVDGSEQYTIATNAHSPAWRR